MRPKRLPSGAGAYEAFLASKALRVPPTGLAEVPELSVELFGHQRSTVTWALRRGRAAIFLNTGLGKTLIELEWARHVAAHTGRPVLILAPLAVTQQTVAEGARFGVLVRYVRDQAESDCACAEGATIVTTNYERLDAFDPATFGGVVLDESGILKSLDGKTRARLIEAFAQTPFRLACSATPSPNDHTELGGHAEFLGVMKTSEMKAQFFVHDGGSTQDWRLKGHAEEAFWRWVCEWAVVARRPSDLGGDDSRHVLPPLDRREHLVPSDVSRAREQGLLFQLEVRGLKERREERKGSVDTRVERVRQLIEADAEEPWVVWCQSNAEQDALEEALPGCASIRGATPAYDRLVLHADWIQGRRRVLISKPSIFGWGLNWQHCARMVFCGVSDSFEETFQAERRCWRFGQKRPVEVHYVLTEAMGSILANLRRKETDFQRMIDGMLRHVGAAQRAAVVGATRQTDGYHPRVPMRLAPWLISEAS